MSKFIAWKFKKIDFTFCASHVIFLHLYFALLLFIGMHAPPILESVDSKLRLMNTFETSAIIGARARQLTESSDMYFNNNNNNNGNMPVELPFRPPYNNIERLFPFANTNKQRFPQIELQSDAIVVASAELFSQSIPLHVEKTAEKTTVVPIPLHSAFRSVIHRAMQKKCCDKLLY